MKSNKRLLVRCKRVLAWLLAVTMVTGTLPASAVYAAELPVVDAEDVSVLPADDVTTGDVAAEDAKLMDVSDPADGGVDEDIKGVIYAVESPTTVYTFDRTDFDENYETTLPYGDVRIAGNWQYDGWEEEILNRVHIIENGADQGSLNDNYGLWNSEWKWKEKAEDNWAPLKENDFSVGPNRGSKVGTYVYTITIPETANKNNEAKIEITLTIAKAEVEPEVRIDPVDAGTLAQSIKADDVMAAIYDPDYYSNRNLTYDEDKTKAEIVLSYAVKNAYDGSVVNGQLLKTGDYLVEITPAFGDLATEDLKAKCTLKPVIVKLQMADLIRPEVTMELTSRWAVKDAQGQDTGDKEYYVTYTPGEDGKGVAIADPQRPADYELKVRYQNGYDAEKGEPKYTDITYTDADLCCEWLDEYGNKMDSAPVNEGTYRYRITYLGQAGLYDGTQSDYIEVTVKPMKLTLKPKWKESAKDSGKDPVFYAGMTARDVIAALDYDVIDESGKTVAVDRLHIWGDASNYNRTVPYEPVFEVRVGEEVEENGTKTIQYNKVINNNGVLTYETSKPYRVQFSTNKGIYRGDGYEYTTNINGSGTDANYEVKVDPETLNANVLTVTMNQGYVAKIDASKIPGLDGETRANGVGDTYEKPIVKVYDRKALYDGRAPYKVAEVTGGQSGTEPLASGTDLKITYTWQEQVAEPVTSIKPGTTDEKVTEYYFDNVGYWNNIPWEADDQGDLWNAGNYRLMITYNDPEHVNYAAPVYVYYRIEKQKIMVEPVTAPNALTETSVSDYIKDNRSQFGYEIWTVDDNGAKQTKLFTTAASGENNTTANEPENSWVEGKPSGSSNVVSGDFYIDWTVKGKSATETDYRAYYTFTDEVSYRLEVQKLRLRNSNYMDYERVNKGTADAPDYVSETLNKTLDLKLDKMGTTELKFKIDEKQLTDMVYNGQEYSREKVASAVKLTKADGTEVTDVMPEYHWYYDGYSEGYDHYEDTNFEWPVNGGTYRLAASFAGNTTYKAVSQETIGTFNITPKEITAEVVLDEEIVAGHNFDDYDYPIVFAGYVANEEGTGKDDTNLFTWQGYKDEEGYYDYGEYPAVSGRSVVVKDDQGKVVSKYKGEKTYTAYVSVGLYSKYSRNYTVKPVNKTFTTVRGNARIEATSVYSDRQIEEVSLTEKIADMTHTIKPEQGIAYVNNFKPSYQNGNRYGDKKVSGNYIVFKIYMPAEYDTPAETWKNAFFVNEIEKAGGYVLDYADNSNHYANYITVAFGTSKEAENKQPQFRIRWENDYIETFIVDFSSAELGADLTKTVEPKSLAFNTPNKKMAVGETQALDVKMSKKLQNDVICLRYKVENGTDVLCVDEKTGLATALSVGKADVSVTPVREDENGQMVAIIGAKPAKVTINVTTVTAPKIQKTVALDNQVTVTYGAVPDGWRREFYILEGKLKADDFEKKIAAMTNGIYDEIYEGSFEGSFVVAPVYDSETLLDAKTYIKTIGGLKADTNYTIYVRNVNRPRTLSDGCKVELAPKGNVRSFKTSKPQVKALDLVFDYGEGKPVQAHPYYEGYTVKLTTGSIKLETLGTFQELPKNVAADVQDLYWVSLPIKDSTDKKTYVAPKLVYQVATRNTTMREGYIDHEGSYYYYPTSYATFDKSGKLKLNMAETVYVRVMDSTTKLASDWERLEITAEPDAIVSKATTLEVGQGAYLENLVDYKEGSTLVRGSNFNRHIVYDQALKDAVAQNPNFELNANGYIRAIGQGTLSLKVKELYSGGEATITLKTKALAAPAGLKSTFVTDKNAQMCFNYDGKANYFKVEVTDGRGRLVLSKLYDKSGDFARSRNYVYDSTLNRYLTYTEEYARGYDLSGLGGNYYYQDAKGKTYYSFELNNLTKLSSYTVNVTALYQNGEGTVCVPSKLVKKVVKTTKMPASYSYLQKVGLNGAYGGIDISYRGIVSNGSGSLNTGDNSVFVSGNTYTLYSADSGYTSHGAYWYPRYMLSDTLTWNSTNKKVATIKQNAGTYTATFKAIKTGSTTIEVKSKLTKKVIARYNVKVSAVGEARYSYFGENEGQSFKLDGSQPLSNGKIASVDNGTAATAYSMTEEIKGTGVGNTYIFTAPTDGDYTFWTTGDSNTYGALCDSDGNKLAVSDGGAAGKNFQLSYKLAAGETVSLDVREWTFGDYAATLNISTGAAK
ncbi:MAG: hypothetical protein K2O32_08325 [Acetatifactor sp.]|nr:hypothetical protein [Acetatifactor sp.]